MICGRPMRHIRRHVQRHVRGGGRTVAVSVVAALGLVAAGCDTGDGTRLQDPTTATTIPPPDTAPLPSVAIDDPLGGGLDPTGSFELGEVDVPPSTEADFRLFAPWAEGGTIDARYTCDGDDVSPPLTWSGVPDGTVELAVALVDESDLTTGRPLIHWVVGGFDPSVERLDEGALPPGAIVGLNFFGETGYTGPCPDPGETHEYRFTLFALGQQLEVGDGTPTGEMLDLIDTVAFAAVSTVGSTTR